jgi:DNA-binding SARP family transcriptional activator
VSDRRVFIGVCGPLDVSVDGNPLKLGGARARVVLATLVAEGGRVVPTSRLIDVVWGEDPADGANATLQVHVSNLRKALAPAALALDVASVIATDSAGYRACLEGAEVDLVDFERAVHAAREARRNGDGAAAVTRYRGACSVWRGDPPAELASTPAGAAIAARLAANRAAALEERFDAELAVANHSAVLAELGAAVDADPLNETLRGLWMLALYRSGRQADALAAHQAGRNALVEALGIEPGPALRRLEADILAQAPHLDVSDAAGPPTGSLDVLLTVLGTSVVISPAYLTGHDGTRIDLVKAITTLGRQSDRDVVVPDSRASRAHAEVRRTPEGFRLLDIGSTNGTKRNGAAVTDCLLADGDVIAIGSTEFRFAQN